MGLHWYFRGILASSLSRWTNEMAGISLSPGVGIDHPSNHALGLTRTQDTHFGIHIDVPALQDSNTTRDGFWIYLIGHNGWVMLIETACGLCHSPGFRVIHCQHFCPCEVLWLEKAYREVAQPFWRVYVSLGLRRCSKFGVWVSTALYQL